jgi:hypothetical protein
MHTDLIVAVPAWVHLAYLISGVCFILALRGLSGPESSRRGNRLGRGRKRIVEVARTDRGRPCQREHLRRLCGYSPDALDV